MSERKITYFLDNAVWPLEKRGSVKRSEKDTKKRGFMLGAVLLYFQGQFRVSRQTRKNEELTKLLNKWMRKHHPKYRYSSIQLNRGTSALHVDQANCGKSVIKAFGNFTGGRLWSLSWPKKSFNIKRGNGKIIDGNVPHITLPSPKGTRYSAVFFNMKGRFRPLPPEQRKYLKELHFPLPKSLKCDQVPQRKRLPEAAKILKAKPFSLPSKYIGDIGLKYNIGRSKSK